MRQKKVKLIRRLVASAELEPSASKVLERKIRRLYNKYNCKQRVELISALRNLSGDGLLQMKEMINAGIVEPV